MATSGRFAVLALFALVIFIFGRFDARNFIYFQF